MFPVTYCTTRVLVLIFLLSKNQRVVSIDAVGQKLGYPVPIPENHPPPLYPSPELVDNAQWAWMTQCVSSDGYHYPHRNHRLHHGLVGHSAVHLLVAN